MNMDINAYSESFINVLDDHVISLNMFIMCLKTYLEKEDDSSFDYMIAPLHSPSNLMMKYPKLKLVLCEFDPLLDDVYRFIDKLQ